MPAVVVGLADGKTGLTGDREGHREMKPEIRQGEASKVIGTGLVEMGIARIVVDQAFGGPFEIGRRQGAHLVLGLGEAGVETLGTVGEVLAEHVLRPVAAAKRVGAAQGKDAYGAELLGTVEHVGRESGVEHFRLFSGDARQEVPCAVDGLEARRDGFVVHGSPVAGEGSHDDAGRLAGHQGRRQGVAVLESGLFRNKCTLEDICNAAGHEERNVMINRRDVLLGGGAAGLAGLAGHSVAAQEAVEPPDHRARIVRISETFAPGEIHVLPDDFHLYWTMPEGRAIRYSIGVAMPGLYEAGTFFVGAKKEWPSWTPTAEMIERFPEYAEWEEGMPGGPGNPLGARALYLFDERRGDTFLRIHGTNNPRTIGRRVSNGCARLTNGYIVDLYERVPLRSRVVLHPRGVRAQMSS